MWFCWVVIGVLFVENLELFGWNGGIEVLYCIVNVEFLCCVVVSIGIVFVIEIIEVVRIVDFGVVDVEMLYLIYDFGVVLVE